MTAFENSQRRLDRVGGLMALALFGAMPITRGPNLAGFWSANPKPIRNAKPRTGRNEPCPCGSGKKFKCCCR